MEEAGAMTHTYAELAVSRSTFDEIMAKLKEADYDHAILDDGRVIDMHGIALKKVERPSRSMPPMVAKWFGTALTIAKHEDRKASWPWYGRLYHLVFVSWRCECCKALRADGCSSSS